MTNQLLLLGTGFSPAKLLLKRKPKSLLDRVHPDYDNCKKSKDLQGKLQMKTRHFLPEDPVFIRNFAKGDPWIPATVESANGPCSYTLQTPDGRSHRRHIDHLRRRLPTTPSSSESPDTPSPPNATDHSPDSFPEPEPVLPDSSPSFSGSPTPVSSSVPDPPSQTPQKSRSGRLLKPPRHFKDFVPL